jgi:hypothetical protein
MKNSEEVFAPLLVFTKKAFREIFLVSFPDLSSPESLTSTYAGVDCVGGARVRKVVSHEADLERQGAV